MAVSNAAEDQQEKPSGAGLSASARPFSRFERMVAWRYLRARRKETFISVIAGFSFVGIMLGVATLIVVMAVMNGFRTELITRILGMNGHVIVQPIDAPLNDYAALTDKFAVVPGVTMAMPLVEGETLASGHGGAGTGALVKRDARRRPRPSSRPFPATSRAATWLGSPRVPAFSSARGWPSSWALPPATRSR